MVLIIISGLPSSGKTHRASQLATHLCARIEQQQQQTQPPQDASLSPAKPRAAVSKVHLISDHSLGIRRSSYAAAATEKMARGEMYSAAKRALGRDAVVILDGPNYIKGWRYQLHCEAKAVGVRSCVVHVGTPPATAREVNARRLELCGEDTAAVGAAGSDDPYDSRIWDELAMRYEEPNGMTRWDSPLFTVPWDDDPDGSATAEKIWDEVVLGIGRDGKNLTPVRMNAATVLTPGSQPNHLYELDRITQGVLTRIQEHQKSHEDEVGGEVSVPGGPDDAGPVLTVHLPTSTLTFAHLQRLRRQFIQLHRQQMGASGGGAVGKGGGGLSRDRVAALFVDWLNDAFQKG